MTFLDPVVLFRFDHAEAGAKIRREAKGKDRPPSILSTPPMSRREPPCKAAIEQLPGNSGRSEGEGDQTFVVMSHKGWMFEGSGIGDLG